MWKAILVAATVFLVFALVLWLVYSWVLPPWGRSDRLAFLEVAVGLGGFFLTFLGAIWAALEFQKSRRTPKLKLLLKRAEEPPTDRIAVKAHRPTGRARTVPEIIIPFHFALDNTEGNGVARHIEISVRDSGFSRRMKRDLAPGEYRLPRPNGAWANYWFLSADRELTFRGGDELLCYDGSQRDVGRLRLEIQESAFLPVRVDFTYTLRAEGMQKKEGKLFIEVK